MPKKALDIIGGDTVLFNPFKKRINPGEKEKDPRYLGRIKYLPTGKTYDVQTQETNLAKALIEITKWAEGKRNTLTKTASAKRTFSEDFLDFLELKKKQGKRPATIANYDRVFRNNLKDLHEKQTSLINREDIEKLMFALCRSQSKDKPLKPGTKRMILSVLSTAFNRFIDLKIVEINPAIRIDFPGKSEKKNIGKALSKEQAILLLKKCEEPIGKVLDWNALNYERTIFRKHKRVIATYTSSYPVPSHLKLIVALGLLQGLRRRNILQLQIKELDLASGWISIDGTKMKSKRDFRMPISPQVLPLLKDHIADLPNKHPDAYLFTKDGTKPFGNIRHSFNRVVKLAREEWNKDPREEEDKFPAPFRMHDMRHTMASWISNENIPYVILKRLLDHAIDEGITGKYTHADKDKMKEAMGKLPGIVNPPVAPPSTGKTIQTGAQGGRA